MKTWIVTAALVMMAFQPVWSQPIGKKAPEFSGKTADSIKISLSDYRGKVVLLDFWASWCVPCRKEMPFLVDLFQKNKEKGLAIIGINIDQDAKNRDKFLSALAAKPEFPIVTDPKSKICPLYNLEGMPFTVLIDRKGFIRFRHVGFKDDAPTGLLKEVKILLQEE
jgi:peroxiredoxin